MKHDLKLLLAIITALGLPVAAHAQQATLTEAQITKIIKDVQTIDPSKGAHPSVMKETVKGDQAVRTGIDSRTELLFNDHTITRLGANSHFSFTEGTRNMSLQSGVMLLQVPKGIGGAKIQTAAVSAAVTGTTIMVEAGKNYTKLIVLEGECCLWPKDDKNANKLLKLKHKTCALAGQEVIMRNGSKTVPPPVYVNLKVLEGSSLLITGNWGSPLNTGPINAAVAGQGGGDYIPTNLSIIGAGTTITVGEVTPPSGGTPPAAPPAPGAPPPGSYGPLTAITNPNPYPLGAGSTLVTDPKIITGGVTGYGKIYRGTIFDGQPVDFLFGPGTGVSFPGNLNVQNDFPNYGIAAFKFSGLNISAMPTIQMSGNASSDLALVSLSDITISSLAPTTLDFSPITEFDLFTAGGNIDIGSNITITDLDRVELYSFGPENNITIDGVVDVNDKFLATTQGSFGGAGTINANNISIQAGGVLTLNETNIEDTQTDTVNGVTIGLGGPLDQLNLIGNEVDVPNGFNGTPPDTEDSPTVDLNLTATAGNDLPGDITLSGNIYVDSLTATADNNVTADSTANINSNNAVQLTAGNNVEIDGEIQNADSITLSATNGVTISSSASLNAYNGTQITSGSGTVDIEGSVTDDSYVTVNSGGDITTGSLSSVSAGNGEDGEGPVTFTSTGGTNTVTIDGDISGSTINITGYNVHTLSTLDEAGLYGNTSITISAANIVTLDGYIQTPSLTVAGINGGPVPASVTVPTTSNIYADNIQINAGNVDMEGYASGDLNEDGSNIFSVNTTGGSSPLTYNAYYESYEDFYSLSGSGSIDSGTVQVTSRGDVILDNTDDIGDDIVAGIVKPLAIVSGDPLVNGVDVNPNGDLYELDLSGSTIEVYYPYTNHGSTLNLTTTGGDISIYGNIDLGVDNDTPSVFTATSSNNIVFEGDYSITADSATLTANQVTTQIIDPAIYSGNITINVSGVNVTLDQNGETPSNFGFYEFSTAAGHPEVGNLTLDLSSSDGPSLSISANSLNVGDIDLSSFDSFSISLTSANDINADGGSTITGASSVTLQVGVAATLAGGDGNISYNNGKLDIDQSNLGSFSLTASSITVNSGFPTLDNASLTLTASGVNEDESGITLNTSLDTPNGSITLTADSGNITVNNALTAGGEGLTTLTANDGGITAHGALSSTGGLNLTTYYGDIDLYGSINTGGDLNINAYYVGSININTPSLDVDGNFSASAINNIVLAFDDATMGGALNLNGGYAIELDNSIAISGSLDLNAGEYIHTPSDSNAKITGATSVNLVLNANTAELSETITGGTSTLYFASDSEQAGFVPIPIDLTDVKSNDSSVSATATSLTLTSAFDEPEISLTLEASSGDLILNGAVTTQNFAGYAYGGNLTINDTVNTGGFYTVSDGVTTIKAPVTATSYAELYSYGGNLVIDAPVTTPSFYGYSTNIITGTGSIIAGNVTLAQGGAATISQPGEGQLTYDSTLNVDLSDGETTSIYLSSGPLTLTTALSLPEIDLTLAGTINTQGNTITAQSVTLEDIQTTTGSATGNATNLSVSGNGVTLYDVSLNGANNTSGAGGTLTASGTVGEGGNATIEYIVSANGGSAGGKGGTITITSQGDINTSDNPSVQANGGAGGGNGGTITLTAQGGTVYSLDVSANGGSANPTGATAGGNGGSITLNSATDLNIYGSITANGGDAKASSSAAGGNGGTVTLNSGGNINVNSDITATSGVNGNTKWTGGNGGSVTLSATGAVTVNSTIEVSSSDLYANRVSAKGGNIKITSHAATGVAINITDSGQLNSLLNQAAAGPGGSITFLADTGGSIAVSGSLRADNGTINIQNTAASGAQVSLSSANLSGDVVKVGALGSNGTLYIGNSRINGDSLISLYAAGSSGSVVFNGNTFLTGAGAKNIAGSTVTIDPTYWVNVSGGPATVFTGTANYNKGSFGSFIGNGVTTKPFAARPGF